MIMPARRSCFCRRLAAVNHLAFREWIFTPGMLFGSSDTWWGSRTARNTPHEGLDLYAYRSSSGSSLTLEPGTLVPLLYDGQIVRIVDDFLGSTVFVRHPGHEENSREFYSMYGHVRQEKVLSQGMHISEGEVICSIASSRKKTSTVPPHLHLSVALVSKTVSPERLDWNNTGTAEIVFFDPMPHLDCGQDSPGVSPD